MEQVCEKDEEITGNWFEASTNTLRYDGLMDVQWTWADIMDTRETTTSRTLGVQEVDRSVRGIGGREMKHAIVDLSV